MSGAAAVALLTFREILRSRALLLIWLLQAAALAGTALLSAASPDDERLRLVLSSGGQASHALLLLTAAVLGSRIHVQERARKHALLLFSKPLRRAAYLAGKAAGLCAALGILALGFGASSAVAAHLLPGTPNLRVPLLPASSGGGAWRFALPNAVPEASLEVRLAVADVPARLDATIRQEGRPDLRVPLTFNQAGEAVAILPETLPEGAPEVRIPFPPQRVAGVLLVSRARTAAPLAFRAALGDWILAATLGLAALGASTFLSTPVALFLATALIALGHAHPMLRDLEHLAAQAARRNAARAASSEGIVRFSRTLRCAMPDFDEVDACPCLDRAEIPGPLPPSLHPLAARLRAPNGLAVCGAYAALFVGIGLAGLCRTEEAG